MKFIKFLQFIVILMFVVLFSVFSLYVYKDNNKELQIAEVIKEEPIEIEIEPIAIEKEVQKREVITVEPRKTNEEEIPINNINKFYYKQLDDYSKIIYDTIEKNKNSLRTGNAKIILPKKIGEIVENKENIEAVFSIAINAFECDNPDLFYFDATKIILCYEKSSLGNFNIYIKNADGYNNYLIDDFNNEEDVNIAQSKIDSVVAEIENEVSKISDDYNKIMYIHDWICENVKYDESLSKTHKDGIYGVFVEKEAVCGGYSKAFKYLLDKANINCIIIQGIGTAQGTENHAWNYVEYNNNWYGVDCTWDDPVIIGDLRYYTEQKYYTYFLKGHNSFNSDHQPFETFYGTTLEINYPELSSNDLYKY